MDIRTILQRIAIIGRRTRIAIYDSGHQGEFRYVRVTAGPFDHSERITRFLLDDERLRTNIELISVSYLDVLKHGYIRVKQDLVEQHGAIRIEAHAYSLSSTVSVEHIGMQILESQGSNTTRSLVICSAGHDRESARLPGALRNVVSVGLLLEDGGVVGYGPLDNLPPSFLLQDFEYPSVGAGSVIKGSSPAVVLLSVLAASIADRVNGPATNAVIQAGLLLLSRAYRNSYLVSEFAVIEQKFSSIALERKSRGYTVTMAFSWPCDHLQLARLAICCEPSQMAVGDFLKSSKLQITIYLNNNTVGQYAGCALLEMDQLGIPAGVTQSVQEIRIAIEGLCESIGICWTGLECSVLEETVIPLKRPEDKVILGISASHDASAVLVVNGKLVQGIQQERITRIKHDGRSVLDSNVAINYCLAAAGLSINDVDIITFNSQALTPEYTGLSQPLAGSSFDAFDPYSAKCLYVSHHLCHALAGFSGAHTSSAKVFVADGSGGVTIGCDDLLFTGPDLKKYLERGRNGEDMLLHTFSVYDINASGYRLISREYARSFNVRAGSSSLGETYAAVSQYVFGSWQDSGKLMGLSPYGDRTSPSLLVRDSEGKLNFAYTWKLSVQKDLNDNVFQHANLAARVQADLELALLDRFNKYAVSQDHIVFSGGIALNSVANHKIRTSLSPKSFFLLPAQHDAGVAIGAAAAALYWSTGHVPTALFDTDFLGVIYDLNDVFQAINKYSNRVKISKVDTQVIATQLSKGKVFGHFSLTLGSEFGPRALGARSILADPRKKETWLHINRWIKYREDFRPFAPMVTSESAEIFFDCNVDLPYMLEVVEVRDGYREALGAVTHVDGTARVQTVDKSRNPEIHRLLKSFEVITGLPVLLNTSFNVRGQPIVETPIQALEMLLSTQLDGVVFGDYLVEVNTDLDVLVSAETILQFAPGVLLEVSNDGQDIKCDLKVSSQGRTRRVPQHLARLLLKIDGVKSVGELCTQGGTQVEDDLLTELSRYVRLRVFNACKSGMGAR
ncbi:Nodulation protein nolO [Pseudomonas sp. R1-43-08]|uniref:carbamoyltransferase C-terminal domain-containing protein n=1 Tax=Pseudomonas sp. R1-43-08 TaxID=1173270 RepID=UPI000F581259|nr:carbamoyltransferase C-terminal domain-containing protein [Pseudomonas sp. R1-43-08]AZF43547.1 Nodulation protein nolO [Pseudomonas sp. R1-43-08]